MDNEHYQLMYMNVVIWIFVVIVIVYFGNKAENKVVMKIQFLENA